MFDGVFIGNTGDGENRMVGCTGVEPVTFTMST